MGTRSGNRSGCNSRLPQPIQAMAVRITEPTNQRVMANLQSVAQLFAIPVVAFARIWVVRATRCVRLLSDDTDSRGQCTPSVWLRDSRPMTVPAPQPALAGKVQRR